MADTLRKKSKDSSENVNFSPKSKKSPFSEKKGSPLSRFFNAAESGSSQLKCHLIDTVFTNLSQ